MAVTDDYKKAQAAVDTAYKNAVTNANKAIATKNAEVEAAYSDINEKAATRRAMTAFKNASTVNGEGVTGTSRLAESVNYENMRNENTAAKTAAKEALSQQALELGYTADADLANAYASNLSARLSAETQERQFGYESEQAEKEQEYQQALETLNEFGKVMTKKQAEILGVPVGTTLKKYYSGSSSSSGSSTSDKKWAELSSAAKKIYKSVDLTQMYYDGFDPKNNVEGAVYETNAYTAYLNQLNQTNTGVGGDAAVRTYLKKNGITDVNEQDIIISLAAEAY